MISRPELDVFDRNPDPALDELTELAAMLSLADYAYIGWIESNRLWFKSRFGFTAADQPHTATCMPMDRQERQLRFWFGMRPRIGAFLRKGLKIPGGERCRSYAGVPLISERHQVVGTLAVLARAAGPVPARAPDASGGSGSPGDDAPGALQPHAPPGAGAAGAAADGAGAGRGAVLCGGYAGFDSGAGGGAGHGRARGALQRELRAIDGAEPGRFHRAIVCGGGAGSPGWRVGSGHAARGGGGACLRAA